MRNMKTLTTGITLLLTLVGCDSSDSQEQVTPPPAQAQKCGDYSLFDEFTCHSSSDRNSIVYTGGNNEFQGIALFLHGAPGSPYKVMNIFDAKKIAAEYGLLAVAPTGIEPMWGWYSLNLSDSSNDDVTYISELITDLRQSYKISEKEVFVLGYSAGGFMNYKLACQIPEELTAIISLSGQFRGDFEQCTTNTPVKVHHLHSETDNEVPFEGRSIGRILPVEETLSHWQLINGCNSKIQLMEQDGVTSDSPGTTTRLYEGCEKSMRFSSLKSVKHEDSYQADKIWNIISYLFE